MDNQFLTTPLLTSPKKDQEEIHRKDQLIRGLEIKNNKLKTQIYKIKSIIQEKFSQLEDQTPTKRQSIMKIQDNHQALNQELANAYKKIKMYEYQINKMEEGQAALNLSQRAGQIQSVIKQKKQFAEKLKAKLLKDQRLVAENTKKLSNNNIQQEIQKNVKLLTDQAKFLKEKLKDLEEKSQIKQKNMKKQYQFIQKLQNQLLENGFSHSQLQQIKHRVMRKNNNGQMSQTNKLKKIQNTQEQIIEDRTIQRYKIIQGQIKLLEKMQNDYQKQISNLQQQKKQAMNKNYISRNKLIQCQNEIQKLEKQILELKGKVLPSNLKPLKPLRSYSTQVAEKTKIKISNQSISKNSKDLAHLLKYDQVGIVSEKGQRFTDRNILGKTNLNSKFIGMTVYFDKNSKKICGFQCFYSGNKKGGQYIRKDRQSKQIYYFQEKFMCQEGDYIKSIGGTLDNNDKLQSLSFITSNHKSHRFGVPETLKKSFNFDIGNDQIPVCVFGSLQIIKQAITKKQYSLVQHFGMEINKENNVSTNRDDPQQN